MKRRGKEKGRRERERERNVVQSLPVMCSKCGLVLSDARYTADAANTLLLNCLLAMSSMHRSSSCITLTNSMPE